MTKVIKFFSMFVKTGDKGGGGISSLVLKLGNRKQVASHSIVLCSWSKLVKKYDVTLGSQGKR